MNKPTLVIVSDWIRRDLHEPLRHFSHFRVVHLYRREGYQDMKRDDYGHAEAQPWTSLFDLWKKIRESKPAILQGAEPWANRPSFVISLVTFVYKLIYPQTKLIWPCFENRPLTSKFSAPVTYLMKVWGGIYGRRADLVIYLNQGAKRNLLNSGIPQEKIEGLLWGTWGIDCTEFSPGKNSKSEIRNQKSELRKNFIVAFAGRVSKAKGVPWLLQAWPAIKKAYPNAKLVLGGPCDDERLKTQIREAGGTWTGGPIKNQDLPDFFREASVVVAPSITTPSWEEQVGMINLQAMACGVPVVTTRSGAIPEYVEDGEGVVLVPEQDAEAIASAVIGLLGQRNLAAMGRKGRDYALNHYEVRANVRRIEERLLKLIETR